MGSLRDGDGGGRPPPDNGGLPDLPPEWGTVVIPDDLTELDREATVIRRERRRDARRSRWRKRLGMAPNPTDPDGDTPPVGVPLLIMSIAIIAALTSLFAITLTTRTVNTLSTAPAAVPATSLQMIDLTLTDSAGNPIRLRETLPAIILLLDGCSCDQLIRDTAGAAPPNVTVLAVDRAAPAIPSGASVTSLADPEQALLATYADGPDRSAQPAGVPTAVLVAADGTVTRTVSPAVHLSDFQAALATLGH